MVGEIIDHSGAAPQSPSDVTILLAGDLVLDVADADHWLSGIAPAIRAADLAIGHLEVPHTRAARNWRAMCPRPVHRRRISTRWFAPDSMRSRWPATTSRTAAPKALPIRLPGSSAWGLRTPVPARNLAAAREPARLGARGRRVALLSYNCVGPETAWATADRAGCNYLRILAADGGPVTPTAALERVDPQALEQLAADIAAARREAQLVIVALHKGIVHTPARLAPYERPLSEAAIEAGADVVVGHHAHILRGIELYRGRPIFHGLGNGCVVTHALSPAQDHPARAEWARRRRELFGFEPDPAYTLAPFHPEAVNAVLGWLVWRADGRVEVSVRPVHVEPPGRPVCVEGARAREVIDYLDRIGADAQLPPLHWRQAGPNWVCQ